MPMLLAVNGEARTAESILYNTAGLLATSLLPVPLGILGWPYLLIGVFGGGTLLLAHNLRLLCNPTDRRLAMANFHASNLSLLLFFAGVVLDVALRRWSSTP